MRRSRSVTGTAGLLLLASCADAGKPSSRTVDDGPVVLRLICLRDVHPLFGGEDVWISANRTATVQLVGEPPAGGSGLWARRYAVTLTPEQWAGVRGLVEQHRLLSLTIPDHPGEPDDGRPQITVTPAGGAGHALVKWASDSQPDFDAVYDALRRLCRDRRDPFFEGVYDWHWQPLGSE